MEEMGRGVRLGKNEDNMGPVSVFHVSQTALCVTDAIRQTWTGCLSWNDGKFLELWCQLVTTEGGLGVIGT